MSKQKIERTAKGTFRLEDGRELKYAPTQSETYSWELVSRSTFLTEKEINEGKALGYDMEKLLRVKECLEQGMGPTAIYNKTGIARSSVINYRKILSVKDSKIHSKDSKKSIKVKSVFFTFLLFSDLDSQTTFSILLILTPLLVLAIGGYLRSEYKRVQAENLAHRDEAAKLHFQMTRVANLSFRREPILCSSHKEVIYYEKVLKHYNNVGRTVHLIEYKKNQNRFQHWNTIEEYRRSYLKANRYEIAEGKERMQGFWNKLKKRGLLDYLHTPKKENWLESKAYIYSVIEFLRENPRPTDSDQARSKYVMDLMPSVEEKTISNNDKILFEYESDKNNQVPREME